MRAYGKEEAFQIANAIMEHDYDYNPFLSERSGYPIYNNDFGEWISDLGTRLEVNTDHGRKTTNIFIYYPNDLESSGFHKNALGVWVM